jgi:conjugal transfer pilin signal peptidase TrbI
MLREKSKMTNNMAQTKPLDGYIPEYKKIYAGLTSKENWIGFLKVLRSHLIRQTPAYLLLAVFIYLFGQNYQLGWNMSESLKGHLFIIHKNEPIKRGDYVGFRMHEFMMFHEGNTFVKLVKGVPGDVVSEIDGMYYVNNAEIGKAKEKSTKGVPLAKGPTGIIPADRYFVAGTHKDSLDSRYQGVGWVKEDRLIGRAYVLF